MSTCVPWANGVPGVPGPPEWWFGTGFNLRLDDPRWVGSTSRTYPYLVGGAGEQAVFRALYHTIPGSGSPSSPEKTYLYLSWWVKLDPQLNDDVNKLYVGFGRDGGGAVVVEIVPFNEIPAVDQPATALQVGPRVAFRSGSGWTLLDTNAPAWVASEGRVWIYPTAHRWAINLRIPVGAAGTVDQASVASALNLGTQFRMWYDLKIRSEDRTNPGNPAMDVHHKFPRTAADLQGNSFPAPETWEDVHLGSDPVACSSGVSLDVLDIGVRPSGDPDTSTAPLGNQFVFNQPNKLAAAPRNRTTAAIPAGALNARFRLANWGSQVTDPAVAGGPWTDIPGGGEVTSTRPVAAGQRAENGAISFSWTPTDPVYQTNPHQCMLVELSSPVATDFLNNSVYRNMDFVPLGTGGGQGLRASKTNDDRESAFERFSRSAEITIKGLPPLGKPRRDVYLYVDAANMPKDEQPGGGGSDKLTAAARFQSYLAGEGGGGTGHDGGGTGSDGGGTGDGGLEPRPDLEDIIGDLPMYRIHVFHDTGRTYRENGKTIRVLEPQGSYGYAFVKDGDSYGWDHQLRGAGLKRISPNFYKVAVPDGGKVTVTNKVATWNEPRPWWWELWEFLMDLWDDITGSHRNPHHSS